MASVTDYGAADDPRSGATSLADWAAAVSAALDGDDTTVDARIAAAVPSDVTDLSSGAATDGQVPTADGAGGIAWEDQVGGGGGGASLSDADPADLGTTAPGVGVAASRDDHVHAMPSAADVGAAAASHTHGLADVTDAGGAAALDVGTTTGTVAAGDDSRLSDARTPTAHASSHAIGGSDALALASAVNTVAASGATETIPTTHDMHDVTMDQACTFTFTSPSANGHTFVLVLRGAYTPTFPASVDWANGSAPTYSTPTVYVFSTVDGGTTWLGSSPGKAFA